MDNVGCTGGESRLVDCPFDRHTTDCTHDEDAGVHCQESMLFACGANCKNSVSQPSNFVM